MKKVFISNNEICRRRGLDATKLARYFEVNNFNVINNPENADYLIFVSCGLTKVRENTAFKLIANLSKFKGELVVVGCLPDMASTRFRQVFDGKYIETRNFNNIDKFFPNFKVKFSELPDANERYAIKTDYKLLRICYGCNERCSYCAAWKAVGPLKSKPIKECLREYKNLIEDGYRYFLICGENVGAYGIDINKIFPDLLQEMSKANNNYNVRWRIHEIHPQWAVKYRDELIEIIRQGMIEYISVPVQSGSKKILNLMNRYSDTEKIVTSIKKFKQTAPSMKIDTHIIIGLPSETEEAFKQTLTLIKEAGFDMVQIYKYSAREGTAAAALGNKIAKTIVDQRLITCCDFFEKEGIAYICQGFKLYKKQSLVASIGRSWMTQLMKKLAVRLSKIRSLNQYISHLITASGYRILATKQKKLMGENFLFHI